MLKPAYLRSPPLEIERNKKAEIQNVIDVDKNLNYEKKDN